MARPLRIDVAGGWYHVWARGIERREIYRSDGDRAHRAGLLGELAVHSRLRVRRTHAGAGLPQGLWDGWLADGARPAAGRGNILSACSARAIFFHEH